MGIEHKFGLSQSNKTGVIIGTVIFAMFSLGGILLSFTDKLENRISGLIIFGLCATISILYFRLINQGLVVVGNDLNVTAVDSKFGLLKTKKYSLNKYNVLIIGSLINLKNHAGDVKDSWLTDHVSDILSKYGLIQTAFISPAIRISAYNFYGYLKSNKGDEKELIFLGGLSKKQVFELIDVIKEKGLEVSFINNPKDKIENILND